VKRLSEECFLYKDHEFIITDLPETYNVTSYSMDEGVARNEKG
jgi:Fe2+ transport system protein B